MKKYFITKLLLCSSKSGHLNNAAELIAQDEDGQDISFKNNPNVTVHNEEEGTLKIKAVREIIEKLAFSTYQGKKSWHIILCADKATLPAQNAMLKLIEEPPVNTQLILTASDLSPLLQTITSRCKIIYQQSADSAADGADSAAKEIFQEIISPKFSFARAIDIAQEYKDREAALALVEGMASEFVNHLEADSKRDQALITIGQQLIEARRSLQQNLNPPLVLENLFFGSIKLGHKD